MMYCVIVCWIAASETPRSRAASGSAGTRIWSDRVPLAVAMTSSHRGGAPRRPKGVSPRSEEHTSELQSLMRISYAVFCLKKKNKKQQYKKSYPLRKHNKTDKS